MQQSLFKNNKLPTKQVIHKKNPNYKKPDKIWQNIQQWNTIEGIELYKPLYNICSQLFMLTYSQKLACLNYYIDEEIDESKTYTVMYAEIPDIWNLPLKERFKKHKDLLEKVLKKDSSLEHDEKIIDSDKLTLFNYVYN